MSMNIDKKLNELFILLDKEPNIKKMKKLKSKITLEEIKSHPFLLMSEKINMYKEIRNDYGIDLDYTTVTIIYD